MTMSERVAYIGYRRGLVVKRQLIRVSEDDAYHLYTKISKGDTIRDFDWGKLPFKITILHFHASDEFLRSKGACEERGRSGICHFVG
jgi:hypothetical protein